jgi:hypothetical protein
VDSAKCVGIRLAAGWAPQALNKIPETAAASDHVDQRVWNLKVTADAGRPTLCGWRRGNRFRLVDKLVLAVWFVRDVTPHGIPADQNRANSS